MLFSRHEQKCAMMCSCELPIPLQSGQGSPNNTQDYAFSHACWDCACEPLSCCDLSSGQFPRIITWPHRESRDSVLSHDCLYLFKRLKCLRSTKVFKIKAPRESKTAVRPIVDLFSSVSVSSDDACHHSKTDSRPILGILAPNCRRKLVAQQKRIA